ncbi:MAG TPA: hypothetical protein VFM88_10250 [Vicinamibacteria bacterium]|nr:hypothetical protein [Vicinamibacteria bacterium]
MPKAVSLLLVALTFAAPAGASAFSVGKPEIRSMSALAFGPEGVLFVGDGKTGAVFALDLGDTTARAVEEPKELVDVEGKLAALLGGTPADVMVHDLAVNPISKNAYLAVSRGRAAWTDRWLLPNDVADASVLVRADADGRLTAVDLGSVRFAKVALPRPVDPAKQVEWKKVSLRADAITHMAYADGSLWIAGLSNEEFAATLWRVKYPFEGPVAITTLENFHGAHGKYETEAPIRAFVHYPLKGRLHVLAAYLCTPLVTFPTDEVKDGRHLRGRTIGEFGSGNYPLDMVVVKNEGRDRLVIANSNLPLMVVDPKDVESFEGEITKEVEGYTGGVRVEYRSGTGIQQLDNLGEGHVLTLVRLNGGRLDLAPLSVRRF